MLKNFFSFVFELIKIVVISLVIIIPVRYFLIQPFYVKGASMEPNFYDHEYLIIDEISYRFEDPQRGDIVVFRYPRNPQEYFIKRLIALPGETVQIKNGAVVIYNDENPEGVVLDEPYLVPGDKTYGLTEERIELKKDTNPDDNKETDEYFVLGDNRNSSKDSRSFGPVNESFITGKVMLRGWPFDRITKFETPEYSF
jgi:signal peptidase I